MGGQGWGGSHHAVTSVHQGRIKGCSRSHQAGRPPSLLQRSPRGQSSSFPPTGSNDRAPRPRHSADTPPPLLLLTITPAHQLHAHLAPCCPTQVSVRGASAPRRAQKKKKKKGASGWLAGRLTPLPPPPPIASGSAFHSGAAQRRLLRTSPGPRPAACSIVWPQRKTIISTQFTVSKH